MSISIGTVLACVNLTENYNPTDGMCISPWQNGEYCQLAFDENSATSLEWYQRNFAAEFSIKDLVRQAQEVKTADGLTAKDRAFQYDRLEDAFENIKDTHGHGHFILALMLSVSQTLKELTDKLCQNRTPSAVVATGGGAKSRFWLAMKAELIGCDFVRANTEEPACRGVALSCKLVKYYIAT